MTREDIKTITDIIHKTIYGSFDVCGDDEETPMTNKDKLLLEINKAICNNLKALEQEPCGNAISREDALMALTGEWTEITDEIIHLFIKRIKALPPVNPQPKTGHCRDCKWWKDSDGAYRRGVGAESQCPINRKEVFEGNGYCYMFEPQESENKE